MCCEFPRLEFIPNRIAANMKPWNRPNLGTKQIHGASYLGEGSSPERNLPPSIRGRGRAEGRAGRDGIARWKTCRGGGRPAAGAGRWSSGGGRRGSPSDRRKRACVVLDELNRTEEAVQSLSDVWCIPILGLPLMYFSRMAERLQQISSPSD